MFIDNLLTKLRGWVEFRKGVGDPSVAPTGRARIWWDATNSLIKFSSSGGSYTTALTAGNVRTTGIIPLDITTARIISSDAIQNTTEGGVPDGNTAPSLARVNGATDKALRLAWAAAGVVEIAFAPIVYPPDLDDTAAVTVHFLAAMAGTTDIPVLTVGFFEGVGDTDAGGATGAVTGTTVAEYSVAIAASNIGAHPKAASITVTPAAHGTDILYVYGAWCEYTKVILS